MKIVKVRAVVVAASRRQRWSVYIEAADKGKIVMHVLRWCV
jgi:hypothetical protein